MPNPVAYESLQQVLEGGRAKWITQVKSFFRGVKVKLKIMDYLRITCHK